MELRKWNETGYAVYGWSNLKIYIYRKGGYRTDSKEVEDIVDRSVSVQTSENSATGEKSLVITLSGKKG